MVSFTRFMSIGLDQCAPTGEGSGAVRDAVFTDLVELWNEEEDVIRELTESQLRDRLECPASSPRG